MPETVKRLLPQVRLVFLCKVISLISTWEKISAYARSQTVKVVSEAISLGKGIRPLCIEVQNRLVDHWVAQRMILVKELQFLGELVQPEIEEVFETMDHWLQFQPGKLREGVKVSNEQARLWDEELDTLRDLERTGKLLVAVQGIYCSVLQ